MVEVTRDTEAAVVAALVAEATDVDDRAGDARMDTRLGADSFVP